MPAQKIGLVAFDAAAAAASYAFATWGTDAWQVAGGEGVAAPMLVLVAVIVVAVYSLSGMYSYLWRYASISESIRIGVSSVAAAAMADLAMLVWPGTVYSAHSYLLAWGGLLMLTAAVRLLIRAATGNQGWRFGSDSQVLQPRTLVVGAGEAGSLAVKRMLSGDPDMAGSPVAVVDDDPVKRGMSLHGVRVAGTLGAIPAIAHASNAQQIVMAIPSANKEERSRIYGLCMQTGLKVFTMPRMQDVTHGERMALRDVDISDLLSRDEIELDISLVSGYVAGKTILVTGGGGSIGSELVRQLIPARPARIVLFDIYENTVYELLREVSNKAREAGVEMVAEIGSITHLPALERVFDRYGPQVIFHAAAHKHVPLMETDPREAIENNVFGTLNVVRMADARGVERFVLISTDKAVNPTNVMGATKRMCEMIIQNYAKRSSCVFAAVRFGNVLGSHGSVIPLFQRQIRDGGPVTLTHRDITRYFMTIPEASRLVVTAGALAHGGEIFVLNMGEPVKIMDLAVNLIRLSGLEPGRDIEIVETGLRPGEKMYEELLMDAEETVPTDNKDITVSVGKALGVEEVRANLDVLKEALDGTDDDVKRALSAAVPTYTPEVG